MEHCFGGNENRRFEPEAGRPIERLGCPCREVPRFEPGLLCTAFDGCSMHATVRVDDGNRDRHEHLYRYVVCHPIANAHLSLRYDGKVVYPMRRRADAAYQCDHSACR